MADNYSREYLIETLEHMLDGSKMTTLFPVTTLGTGQRFLAKGAYVLRLAPKGDPLRYVQAELDTAMNSACLKRETEGAVSAPEPWMAVLPSGRARSAPKKTRTCDCAKPSFQLHSRRLASNRISIGSGRQRQLCDIDRAGQRVRDDAPLAGRLLVHDDYCRRSFVIGPLHADRIAAGSLSAKRHDDDHLAVEVECRDGWPRTRATMNALPDSGPVISVAQYELARLVDSAQ